MHRWSTMLVDLPVDEAGLIQFSMFFLLKWCIFKWQVLFVILKGKVRRTHIQMLISRKTVGPFIVSKGPPMRMVWGSQGPSKSCYKWKPWYGFHFQSWCMQFLLRVSPLQPAWSPSQSSIKVPCETRSLSSAAPIPLSACVTVSETPT